MQVQKANGDWENFNSGKLRNYLLRLGMGEDQSGWVTGEVERQLAQRQDKHITFRELREVVTGVLATQDQGAKWRAKYTLKEAIYALGPAGYQFEQFVGRLFAAEGFKVQVGTEMQGNCVSHEIDVYAIRENENHFVECKFHNKEGTRSDVTVALYSHARFRDLHNAHPEDDHLDVGWLATNTKLTTQSLEYARCANMQVLNLYFPEQDSIIDRVMRHNLFPVSSLPMLIPHLQQLFNNNIIVIQDLLKQNQQELNDLHIPSDQIDQARQQAEAIIA